MTWGKQANFVLPQASEPLPNLGEGVSRTSASKTSLFEIHISFQAGSPIKEWIRAASKRQAIKFAKNRHPLATTILFIKKHASHF